MVVMMMAEIVAMEINKLAAEWILKGKG
jgi:hypothetical protein